MKISSELSISVCSNDIHTTQYVMTHILGESLQLFWISGMLVLSVQRKREKQKHGSSATHPCTQAYNLYYTLE